LKIANESGKQTAEPSKMATILNFYFTEIGQKLASKIDTSESNPIDSKTLTKNSMTNSFYLTPINISKVLMHMSSPSSSPCKAQELMGFQ